MRAYLLLGFTVVLLVESHVRAEQPEPGTCRYAPSLPQEETPVLDQDGLRFEDYPAEELFQGTPATVQLDSTSFGRTYRIRLRNGAQDGPNFAGAFTLVLWGCGSGCQVVVVVDARSGRLSAQTLRTTAGIAFCDDSRLLIADPIHPGYPPLETCAVCGTRAAYEWTGERLEPVGEEPHPHLREGV